MQLRDDCPPFWREITLRAAERRVDAEVIDNVHHFVVTIHHNEAVVTAVKGVSVRVPWVTCPGAAAQLALLVGTPVTPGTRVRVDQTQQCTHMLDLARLAIAQASRPGTRRYRVSIEHDPRQRVVVAQLERDGALFLEWQIRQGIVQLPPIFAGHDLDGRSIWSDAVVADPDLVEAGLILRRAAYIFRSRGYSTPLRRAADAMGMSGVCYSFQPGRAEQAVRPSNFVELP